MKIDANISSRQGPIQTNPPEPTKTTGLNDEQKQMFQRAAGDELALDVLSASVSLHDEMTILDLYKAVKAAALPKGYLDAKTKIAVFTDALEALGEGFATYNAIDNPLTRKEILQFYALADLLAAHAANFGSDESKRQIKYLITEFKIGGQLVVEQPAIFKQAITFALEDQDYKAVISALDRLNLSREIGL